MTENNKYLDKLFQSKFAGFETEPPASVWNNIHQELHGKGGSSVNPVNLATLAALVLISGLLGFSIINDVPEQNNEVDPALLTSLHSTDQEGTDLSAFNTTASSTQPVQEVIAEELNKSIPEKENYTSVREEQHATRHEQQNTIEYTSSFAEKARLAKMKKRRSLAVHAGLKIPGTEAISVRDSKQNPVFARMSGSDKPYNRKASWQMGVFFTPEVGFYPDDSIPNQRSYTFDVTARWKKNEFFIESGLGVSFSSDNGKYAIDYEKFLGSYDDVYNVTFDTTAGGVVVPNYHTTVVNVYDSISKYKIDQTKNNYTYLQLPVYIGFQKEVDRFGWFVKGGPILSLLVHKNIPEPDAGYNRIIGLDQQMATRVNMHWQLALSLGMTYQLSNNVSIAIEPTFRYYLNSKYELKYISTRHPYSLGLRTGLLFNF